MDAAVALQRKKTIKILSTVEFSLSKQGIFFVTLRQKEPATLVAGSFFVLELVGFEQVGRPQTAKNSPADCFLDRGLRIHQLPPKRDTSMKCRVYFFIPMFVRATEQAYHKKHCHGRGEEVK